MSEEKYYIVDWGSSYISKKEYWQIENGKYKGGWREWQRKEFINNPPELDQVLTEDGYSPEEEEQ